MLDFQDLKKLVLFKHYYTRVYPGLFNKVYKIGIAPGVELVKKQVQRPGIISQD